MNDVIVIGGGPAGMRAAEVASAELGESGGRGEPKRTVLLCDAQGSFGRKFLIAGRGGLNLTHGEPVEKFPDRYGPEQQRWRDLLGEFGPAELQQWVHSLGIETHVGSSGRVFPVGQKSAALLRAWSERLRRNGVQFQTGVRFTALRRTADGWLVRLGDSEQSARAVVLALGGASWPETGSDGLWPEILAPLGIECAPWQPANCGWEVDWPAPFLEQAEGKPLKNLFIRAGEESVSGELLVTRYGLEGGAIYRLGPTLRRMPEPTIIIDFKPQLTADQLRERAAQQPPGDWFGPWKLHPAARALLQSAGPCADLENALARVKSFAVRLTTPRPIAEAISSAGGVKWEELDESLMLRKAPGVFLAGEMIDWEAPTGGYLLQGCFATGTRAGLGAARFRGGAVTDSG